MADVLSAVSIALLLAGKVSRNLPAVCHPPVFASRSDPSTRQIPSVATVGPRHDGRRRQVDLDGEGKLVWTEHIADKKWFLVE